MTRYIELLGGVLAVILGPTVLVLIVIGLNQILANLNLSKDIITTQFHVSEKKVEQEKTFKPKPQPKKIKKAPRQDLHPNLDSIIAGSDFGLEIFAWLDQNTLGGELIADMKDAAMTADTVDQAPMILQTAPLDYPKYAQVKGIKGFVTLNLLVTPGGRVEKTHILASDPEGIFDAAATSSVKKWKFEPGMNKGQKVAVWVEQTIQFALN